MGSGLDCLSPRTTQPGDLTLLARGSASVLQPSGYYSLRQSPALPGPCCKVQGRQGEP